MKIVFVSSECSPYASTGGLADVSAALPAALAEAGHEVVRILPMYRAVIEGQVKPTRLDVPLRIPVSYQTLEGEVWELRENPRLKTLFVRRDEFFDRGQLYGRGGRDYDDNGHRFIFFQKAVVALIDALQLAPDIVHCNDWQTGLIPMYLRHGFQSTARLQREKTVFTIHNLAYQGIFPGADLALTGLPFSCFTMDTMEFYGNMSFLKAGCTSADLITTVSPSYASEIITKEYGFGLDGILRALEHRLVGIVNGIDYDLWDPANDPHLARPFDAKRLSGKKACREALLTELGLDLEETMPLFGMVTRLVEQKGLDLMEQVIEQMMDMNLGVVILGAGEEHYEECLRAWSVQWPGRFAGVADFLRPLSHRIEAGCDFYLMPSEFEPCGLNQMYSQRYGTPPVVHRIGGLKDTVVDVTSDPENGTGFVFDDYKPESLLKAVGHAIEVFQDAKALRALRQRAMKQDFSWKRSAERYLEHYRELLG